MRCSYHRSNCGSSTCKKRKDQQMKSVRNGMKSGSKRSYDSQGPTAFDQKRKQTAFSENKRGSHGLESCPHQFASSLTFNGG